MMGRKQPRVLRPIPQQGGKGTTLGWVLCVPLLLPRAGCVTSGQSCHFIRETASVNQQAPSEPRVVSAAVIYDRGSSQAVGAVELGPFWGHGNISPCHSILGIRSLTLHSQAFPGNCWSETLLFSAPHSTPTPSQGQPGLHAVWSPVSLGGCLSPQPCTPPLHLVFIILVDGAPRSLPREATLTVRGSETAAFLPSVSTFPVPSPRQVASSLRVGAVADTPLGQLAWHRIVLVNMYAWDERISEGLQQLPARWSVETAGMGWSSLAPGLGRVLGNSQVLPPWLLSPLWASPFPVAHPKSVHGLFTLCPVPEGTSATDHSS